MSLAEAPLPTDDHAPVVYLHPGQVIVSREPVAVSTILGSCVAVCLFSPRRRIGGVNHYLLPHWASGESSARFGNVALRRLVDALLGLGCPSAELRAKVFGGARVTQVVRNEEGGLGGRNVDVARRLLALEGIPVLAEDVGGARGRKLVFRTDDGSARVRLL